MTESRLSAWSRVREPIRLGPLTLRNRIFVPAHTTNFGADHLPSQRHLDYHVARARGGVAAIIFESIRVQANCVGRPQAVAGFDPRSIEPFRRIGDAVRAEGAKLLGQIIHLGRQVDGDFERTVSWGPSAVRWSATSAMPHAMTPEDMASVVEAHVTCARHLVEAGLDGIEIQVGHGHLLQQFLSPSSNRRDDDYGGSLENRLRFIRQIIDAVRGAVDDRVAVIAKFNMADGVERGLWLEESLQFASMLEEDGQLDALVLTGGSSLLNGMYFFRGDVPMEEFIATQSKVVGLGLRVLGSRIFPELPFEEAFFLPFARQFREALSMPLVLLGGINRRDTIENALDEGFEMTAMARALLRQPDLPNLMRDEPKHHNGLCVHCNKCLPTIYSGTRCVLVNPGATASV